MATLRDLGLSEYEARVYRALLSVGTGTAKELSRASDVPMGRIYDVLGDLEAVGIVRSQNASRPKKYAPVEPDAALDRLVAEKRREFEAELSQYESVVEELTEQLEAAEPTGNGFWTVAIGPGDTIDLLEQRLDAATDRIVMVASEPSAGFDLGEVGDRVVSRLLPALSRGVSVSVLVSATLLEAIPEGLMRRYGSRVLDHPDFEIRVTEEVSGAFTLIDRAEVCIEVPNPLDPDEAFALIDVTDPEFAANAYGEFESSWERADPYADDDRLD